MIKVFVTLNTYDDWVWSHPNPTLLDKYAIKGGDAYKTELASLTELLRRSWHADPVPSEIDWVAVTQVPKPMIVNGKSITEHGHRLYGPAALNVIFNQQVSPYLNSKGQVVGYSSGGARGRQAFSITLLQGSDGQWRIDEMYKLNPHGGLAALAK